MIPFPVTEHVHSSIRKWVRKKRKRKNEWKRRKKRRVGRVKERRLTVSEKRNQRVKMLILEKDGKGMKYVGEQMCYNDSDGDTDGDYSLSFLPLSPFFLSSLWINIQSGSKREKDIWGRGGREREEIRAGADPCSVFMTRSVFLFIILFCDLLSCFF